MHVRFTPIADIRQCERSVRFVPEADMESWEEHRSNCAETNFGFGTFLERLKDHAIGLSECELDSDLVGLRFWN